MDIQNTKYDAYIEQPVNAGQCRVVASMVGLQHGCNMVAIS